ncbi:DNA polymerase III, subunits gamma and tau [mine drainage metagenome]|uniref:DNA-directed DNA polymerase n=3 Tax=mine drainage metagenome TaxID=410659 RepID=T1D2V6_9ZZZZ
MIGQESTVRALQNALGQNRLHPVLLFSGTRGVGKTTLGRLIAKALNCEQGMGPEPCGRCQNCEAIDSGRFPDFLEIDAASRTRVEETRELLANVSYLPSRGRARVYLIDEVHMLSGHSFNALLKTLEEPPPHVYFLLATTEPEKVPVTILSRCLRFALRRVPVDQIAGHLALVAGKEAVPSESAALGLLADAAQGSVRDALSLMDLALTYGAGSVREADVAAILGTLDHEQLHALASAILKKDRQRMGEILGVLHALEPDYAGILESLARLFVTLACRIELGPSLPAGMRSEDEARFAVWASETDPLDLQIDYEIIRKGLEEMRAIDDPELTFDMTCVRLLAFEPDRAVRRAPAGQDPGVPTSDWKPPQAGPGREAPSDSPPAMEAPSVPASRRPLTQAEWPSYVSDLEISGMAREILNHTICTQYDGKTLMLELAQNFANLLTTQLKSRIDGALRERENRDLEVRIEIGDGSGETLAKQRACQMEQEQEQVQAELNRDPNVQKLLERGAEIRKGSVRPTRR